MQETPPTSTPEDDPQEGAAESTSMMAMPLRQLKRQVSRVDRKDLQRMVLQAGALMKRQESRFGHVLEINSALGQSLHIDDLLDTIVSKITQIMDAERSTLFLVDEQTGELWSKVVQGNHNIEIRLQNGQGIAGWVALTGQSLNIRDAYNDPRFNATVDRDTGYQTRNILCQPVRNKIGDIIGVIQVLNKRRGAFTDDDEHLLSALATQASVAIENSKLYLSAVERNMELIDIKDKLERKIADLDALYDMERIIGRATNASELCNGVFERVLELVHANAVVLSLRQSSGYALYHMVDRGDWSKQLSFGSDHQSSPTPTVESLEGLRQVHRFGAEDVQTPAFKQMNTFLSLSIENALIVPLMAEDELLGVMEVYNTIDVDERAEVGFSQDDIKLVSVIASQMAVALAAQVRRDARQKNERLATIGQLLSGVLHDFKNPMAIISGYVQLMAKAQDLDTRQGFAQNVLKQLEQLNQMTKELLSFARGDQNILLRKVFLHKMMGEVQELLAPELERNNVTLELNMDYRNDIKLDEVKIKRAILNLGRNAAEAMQPQGGGTFTIGITREQDDVVMTFADTGPGVPESIRANLFESFVTQGKEHGTGLGLAIVKRIVEEHGGTIRFDTASGQGTTFTLTLPISPDPHKAEPSP